MSSCELAEGHYEEAFEATCAAIACGGATVGAYSVDYDVRLVECFTIVLYHLADVERALKFNSENQEPLTRLIKGPKAHRHILENYGDAAKRQGRCCPFGEGRGNT